MMIDNENYEGTFALDGDDDETFTDGGFSLTDSDYDEDSFEEDEDGYDYDEDSYDESDYSSDYDEDSFDEEEDLFEEDSDDSDFSLTDSDYEEDASEDDSDDGDFSLDDSDYEEGDMSEDYGVGEDGEYSDEDTEEDDFSEDYSEEDNFSEGDYSEEDNLSEDDEDNFSEGDEDNFSEEDYSEEDNLSEDDEDNFSEDYSEEDNFSDDEEDEFSEGDEDDSFDESFESDTTDDSLEENDSSEQGTISSPIDVLNDDDDDEESSQNVVALMSDEMRAEYDRAFSGEERANNLLRINRSNFSITYETINITEIGIGEATKLGRKQTVSGLTTSIRDLGVVTPIHVYKVAEEDATEDYKYVLIDGLRRMYGALKNRHTKIPAIVWDFKNKERGLELLLPLGLVIDRQQKHKWQEVWDLHRVLEMQTAITPATLEYLLKLESGDAMRLKDVMLGGYSEPVEKLLSGEKTLDACYKMLQKLRKEEDELEREDATGFRDTVEDADDIVNDIEDVSEDQVDLSDNDVRELLQMADSLDGEDVSSDDFNDMVQQDGDFAEQQKVGERHPLDPVLRQSVLARDDFTCKCCGMRMIGARLGLIAVHHIIPVSCKGKDELNNLVTLCLNDHVALHVIQRNGGTIMMSEDDFKNLLPSEQTSLKRALKLARVALDAGKRLGRTREQILEDTRNSIKHPMPGANLRENQAIYNAVQRSQE